MNKHDRKLWIAKRLSIGIVSKDVDEENKAKNSGLSEDSKRRKEIQTYILSCHVQRKSEEEILEGLKNKFGAPEYQKYHMYFQTWVDNVVGKKHIEER